MKITNEGKEYIRNNYRSMKTKDIAKNLGLEYETVKNFATREHLKKDVLMYF